jgi:drug/metabolite transporter (DMT)-like permease
MIASQSFGVGATTVLLAISGEAVPPGEALWWAGLAGISGIVGLAFFYRALSGGKMALIAPIAGVVGAALPAAVALLTGDHLSGGRLAGLVAALLAIACISVPAGDARRHATLGPIDLALALLAGAGFAAFFLCLDRSAAEGGDAWWPLLAVRVVGLSALIASVVVVAAVGRAGSFTGRVDDVVGWSRLRAPGGPSLGAVLPLFVIAGLGDQGGNVFFLFANQHDALSVAVVMSSLYPVVTVLWAAALLHERLSRLQVAGVALAALAAGLIALG